MSKEKNTPKTTEPKPKYDIVTLMHMGIPFVPELPEPKVEEEPKTK